MAALFVYPGSVGRTGHRSGRFQAQVDVMFQTPTFATVLVSSSVIPETCDHQVLRMYLLAFIDISGVPDLSPGLLCHHAYACYSLEMSPYLKKEPLYLSQSLSVAHYHQKFYYPDDGIVLIVLSNALCANIN